MKRFLALCITLSMLLAMALPCAAADTPEADPCPGWGDMDGDGEVTSGDARLVLRQSVRLESYSEDDCYRCDVDKDGEITSSDARFVLRLSVNLEERPAHETVTVEGRAATCLEPGLTDGVSCAICGQELVKPQEIPTTGHTLIPIKGKDPTCTETGLTDGEYCSVCEQVITPQETLPVTDHTEAVDPAVEPTCTQPGLTEGKHCAVCGKVLAAQQPVDPLRHADPVDDPAPAEDVCIPAKLCGRCGEVLTPAEGHKPVDGPSTEDTCVPAKLCSVCGKELEAEVKHDYPAGAAITVEKGIECTVCHKVKTPSFNELVNGMKDGTHYFSTFSKTITNIADVEFGKEPLSLLLKPQFEKEFEDSMGETVDYSAPEQKLAVNSNNFELIGKDTVSELTDADVDSVKTEETNEIGFLKDLPDTFTAGRNDYDLTAIKAKQPGDMLKVTVKIKPDKYSEAADQGGSRYIKKIYSSYGEMVDTAMKNFSEFGGEMIKSENDSLSNATITYYFDRTTFTPVAAEYNVDMKINQDMKVFISDSGLLSKTPTMSMSFDITTNISNYFFFDSWFD